MEQYDTFFECYFHPGSSKRWLAMLNLMFAIGSMYGKLVGAEWKGESEVEHLKFFTRARILSLDETSMFEVPDLQQVQVMSLAGIYLIASNQTNRYLSTHAPGSSVGQFYETKYSIILSNITIPLPPPPSPLLPLFPPASYLISSPGFRYR